MPQQGGARGQCAQPVEQAVSGGRRAAGFGGVTDPRSHDGADRVDDDHRDQVAQVRSVHDGAGGGAALRRRDVVAVAEVQQREMGQRGRMESGQAFDHGQRRFEQRAQGLVVGEPQLLDPDATTLHPSRCRVRSSGGGQRPSSAMVVADGITSISARSTSTDAGAVTTWVSSSTTTTGPRRSSAHATAGTSWVNGSRPGPRR